MNTQYSHCYNSAILPFILKIWGSFGICTSVPFLRGLPQGALMKNYGVRGKRSHIFAKSEFPVLV